MHARAQASNRLAKANRASHGPRVSPHSQAKVREIKTMENPKRKVQRNQKCEPRCQRHTQRQTNRKLVSQVKKTRNQRQAQELRNLHTFVPLIFLGTMAGVLMNGMMTGVLLDGTKVWEQMCDTSASSVSLGRLDVSATSCPKRFEWVKMNLDTGAAVNTFPLNFGAEGTGDGRSHRTAIGEWIPDGGAWQLQGYDENGLLRSLNGRLTGVHKVFLQCGRNRVQRTTGFLPRTRRWIHDSYSQ